MATTGTWCTIYDGGDIGAIVRGGKLICSNPFDHLFTRSEISAEHETDFMVSSAKACEQILPFSMKQDPDGAENVSSTASSPRASEYQKYEPRSPKRETMALDNSSQKDVEKVQSNSPAIKTEANDQSPSKMCSSPKLAGPKRRKSQQRSIVCIPMAEGSWNKQGGAGVASDLWSWRKYGQKPIKGSPYPRCSSSKGCPARKQVERSRTDPTMLVITYTADHNHASPAHRRALARSSGQNSLHDKKEKEQQLQEALSLSVPDAAIATDNHDDALSPPDGLTAQQDRDHQGPINSECLDNSTLVDEDQHEYLSANHMFHHDDLFQTYGDFPSLFHRDFATRSDEEDDCNMGDPFNLFDWSFSTNEWPNS
ncbi:WRKY transcription factor 22 isoform X2 [Cryptomeria japonica]|uniref:WRKY transcription factor 22 isoform X2 n=1 Tax=Cryptomeria japonica TaxID=3369 RepID=UPI0027D9F90F|nr:WRKY transcription factor 22 isoform X2 [Cryptomeria japonica]